MSAVVRTLDDPEPAGADRQTPTLGQRGPLTLRALARAASGSFALNISNTAATVLTTIALARLMELDAFGTYSWLVATIYMLTVPALLGVDRLLVRDVAVYLGRGSDGHVRGLLRHAVWLTVAMSALILVAAGAVIAAVSPEPATAAAVSIGLLALPALALAWIAQSALMGMHRVVLGQLSELLLRPMLLLLLVIAAALLVRGPIEASLAAGLFVATAAVSAANAWLILRRNLRARVKQAQPVHDTRRWLAAGGSLVLLSGALFVNSLVGVVMVGILDSAAAAGLYAVAQRGALLVAFPLLALNAALAPTAARLWAQGDVRQLQRLVTFGTRAVLLAALPIALVFALAGAPLLELVFGASFTAAAAALAILSAGQVANSATGSVATLLMMTGNQWRAGVGIGLGLALNFGLCLALIPGHGAAGAAIAAVSGLAVANLVHVVMARQALGVDPTALGLEPRQRR